MAKYASSDYGFLLIGKYDLTSITNKLEVSVNDPIVETTPFGATLAQFSKPGIKKYSIEGHDAWYDDATWSINSALQGWAATTGFMFASSGNIAGRMCICTQGFIQTGYKRVFTVGDMTKAAFEASVTGAIDECKVVTPLTTKTGTGHNEADDVDWKGVQPAGTTGGVMYLSVQDIVWNGATALLIEVESSSDGITYGVHTSFTSITSAGFPTGGTSEVKTMAGTINRYLAAKWTFTGGTNPTATFAVAAKVN